MDAYHPISDTVRPSPISKGDNLPWRRISETQTLFWYSAPKSSRGAALPATDGRVQTFILFDTPALAGLERLRTFRSWGDNWDAEGSKAPDVDVLEAATKVFGLLSLYRVPSVTLNADGQPMFVFDAPLQGEVVVTDVNHIEYFFSDKGAPEGEGIDISHGELPADLIEYLHAA